MVTNGFTVNANAWKLIGKEPYPWVLWGAIFHHWNRYGRRDWIGVSEKDMLEMTGMSRGSFYKAKKRLVEAGLIGIKSGKKGKYPEYHIYSVHNIGCYEM